MFLDKPTFIDLESVEDLDLCVEHLKKYNSIYKALKKIKALLKEFNQIPKPESRTEIEKLLTRFSTEVKILGSDIDKGQILEGKCRLNL